MKSISIIVALLAGLAFVGCGDDDDKDSDPVVGGAAGETSTGGSEGDVGGTGGSDAVGGAGGAEGGAGGAE